MTNEHPPGTCYMLAQNSEEWMRARKTCSYNASGIGALCGLSPYKGPRGGYEWVKYKTDPRYASDPPFQGNAYTQQGHEREPTTIAIYKKYTGNDVTPGLFWTAAPRRLSGPIGASPDGLVVAQEGEGVLEVKAPVHKVYEHVPMEHIAQMHVQMALTGRHFADYVAICYKTQESLAARVYFSAPFYSWIISCLEQVDRWMADPTLPYEEMESHPFVKVVPLEKLYGRPFTTSCLKCGSLLCDECSE